MKIIDLLQHKYNTFFYATMCHICKRFGDDVSLKRCSSCKMITYCGQQHQKQHWLQHKSFCKAIKEVQQHYNVKNCCMTSQKCDHMKVQLIELISSKLGRPMEIYEMEMLEFPRECIVCHEQDGRLLLDCNRCAAASFCKNHRDNNNHKDICATLELCLHSNLYAMNKDTLDLGYLRNVSNEIIFRDMDDFIKIFVKIQTNSDMLYNILVAIHSQLLSRPLTLFHAMQILNYVPKRKDLVVHAIAANYNEETTCMTWEVLLHLIEAITSLVIIMIGPELSKGLEISKFGLLPICNNCMLQKKKISFEFHKMFYQDYMRSSLFVKPDLVVGFNAGIHLRALTSPKETWVPSVQMLARQNCPLILTCYMQYELGLEIDRINTILNRKIDHLYSGKNLFTSLRPHRILGYCPVFYQNQYLIIYRSLCN